jgi:monoamine oxidase
MEVNCLRYVRTAIIGSGVAGMSCANNLLKNDYDDFLIFEALDRIGGRVFTIEHENSFLEIGAQVNLFIYQFLFQFFIVKV